jgi:hypothetical protein
MKDGLKGKGAVAIRGQNGRRGETEKAAAFLRESGAAYLRKFIINVLEGFLASRQISSICG